MGAAAGLNLLIALADPAEEARVLERMRSAGVAVEGLLAAGYYEHSGRPGIVVGYAAAAEHAFPAALEAFLAALPSAEADVTRLPPQPVVVSAET